MNTSNKELINHIKTYTTFEWLYFIKVLENTPDEELLKIAPNQMERYNLKNSNWYSKLLDLALRLSNYENEECNKLPNKKDYRKFLKLYLGSFDSESNFKSDIDYSFDLGFSKCLYEQNKNYASPVNDMGRLIELYSEIEPHFKEFFGLTPKQILFFYFLNYTKHAIYEPFDIVNMLRLLKDYDNKITEKKLKRFLDIFSITIKKYRENARDKNITKNTMKSIRLIEEYSIIRLKNDKYFIPSINVLLGALSYKIFAVLNKEVKNSDNFKRSFGDPFENYLRKLTKFSHSKYFYECNELIKELEDRKKAEFYLLKNDTSLLIESKVLHIDENIILNSSAIELESKFKNTITAALKQIDSCFKKLNTKNKYALIVIHTHIPLLENFMKFFKHKYQYDFLDNVKIISVLDYEIMIHNRFEKIIEYFELPQINNKSQIAHHFERKNKFLETSCLNLKDELRKNNQSDYNR